MRIKTIVTAAAIATASTANASLPPNGGLSDALVTEKEYLDELAPNQLSNLIEILNDGAASIETAK